MPDDELQGRYVGALLDQVNATRYPSAPMLDGMEAAIGDLTTARRYVASLLDHIEQDQYPSPAMMARIQRLIEYLPASSSNGSADG